MSSAPHPPPLEQLLESLVEGFTLSMATYVAEYRASPHAQARVDELATNANEGTLTDDERREYTGFVSAGTLIAIMQSKARKRLAVLGPLSDPPTRSPGQREATR